MIEAQVVVVGAGISGLAVERELRRRGVEAAVLEASDRPGGVICSGAVEDRVLDQGPQRTRLSPAVARLIEELGLEERVVVGRDDLPLYVYRDGRLRRVPLSFADFATTDLLSARGKLRVLAEPLLAWTGQPPGPRETVASFVTRRLGAEAYRNVVGPLYGGLYGSDPGEMLMEHSLGRALEAAGLAGGSLLLGAARWMASRGDTPPPVTFRDGMAELTDALHRDAAGRVRLSCRVTAVRRRDGASTASWEVETGEGRARAERVVLACPADAADRILGREAPAAARRLGRLRYNTLAVVHLCGDCGLEGYGYQAALSGETATLGVTWNASLFDRDGVYTAYLGGGLRPGVLDLEDGELGRLARREFREATGCDARVLRVGRTRMPAWDRSWTALEDLTLPPGIHLCANFAERAGLPGRLRDARETAEEIAAAF